MASSTNDLNEVASKCKSLYGDDLVVALRAHYKATYSAESSVEMIGTGEWLDKDDLETKYQHKPDRLKAILKNTGTFWCPTSETLLYEDMTYKSLRTDKINAKREMSVTCEVGKKVKKAKVKKVETEEGGAETNEKAETKKKAKGDGKGKDEGPIEKPLTEAQQKKLTKAKEDLEKLCKIVKESTKELDGDHAWLKFIPGYVQKLLEEAKVENDMTIAQIDFLLGSNSCASIAMAYTKISKANRLYK